MEEIIKQQPKKKTSFFMRQLLFFTPLGITGFLLAFNGTIVNAGLARLPSPILLISSFAVARTFMQFIISPLHMIRPMVTALANNGADYIKVRRFALTIAATVTTILAIIAMIGVAEWVFESIMGLPEATSKTAVILLKLLIFYPIGLFFKDFYHGVLIKFEKTSLITAATLIRIGFVVLFVTAMTHIDFIPGVFLAGLLFLTGTYSEGMAALIFTKASVRNIVSKLDSNYKVTPNNHHSLTGKYLIIFYLPLVMTTYIKTLAMPIINTGLAKASNPEVTITTFAVAWALIMSLNNPLNMFHQVSIKFIEDNKPEKNNQVFRFGLILATCMSALIALLAITPLGHFVFERIVGVDTTITALAVNVLIYAIPLPFITVLREYFWGIMIKRHHTGALGIGKAINVFSLLCGVLIIIVLNPINAAAFGVVAILISETLETLFIIHTFKKK